MIDIVTMLLGNKSFTVDVMKWALRVEIRLISSTKMDEDTPTCFFGSLFSSSLIESSCFYIILIIAV